MSREVCTPLPGSLCAALGPCGRVFVLLGSRSSLLGLSPLCAVEMWWGQGPALPRGHLWLALIDFFSLWQPALLYLVPACIGFPLLVALAKGEVTEMFRWASAGVGAVLPTALEHRKHADVPTPGHSWRDRFIWAGSGCACARAEAEGAGCVLGHAGPGSCHLPGALGAIPTGQAASWELTSSSRALAGRGEGGDRAPGAERERETWSLCPSARGWGRMEWEPAAGAAGAGSSTSRLPRWGRGGALQLAPLGLQMWGEKKKKGAG